jgi:hypothetical protein
MTKPRPIAAVLVALLFLSTAPAAAQVGHSPGRSPYRDIPKGHTVTPFIAQFGGSGGRFGIAPHDGPIFGVRYDIRTSYALQLGIGVGRGTLERLVVDPFVAVAERVSGPVDQKVSFLDLNLQLNLTGNKTWHRLAPFVGLAGGLTFPYSTASDSSGFELGHKIYFAPHAGFRYFVLDRVHLRADARVLFWKLNYPVSFTQAPEADPTAPPVIDDGRVAEWSTTSWLQVGVGIGFSP